MSNSAKYPIIDATTRSEKLAEEAVYDALANERRRLVVSTLAERSAPVDAESLARSVAAREADAGPAAIPEDEVDRVHTMLYHSHLPKLADVGIVEYDAETETVSEIADEIESLPV